MNIIKSSYTQFFNLPYNKIPKMTQRIIVLDGVVAQTIPNPQTRLKNNVGSYPLQYIVLI